MSSSKVDAVVENWFPRFLANGLGYFDVRRILDHVDDWTDWAPSWTSAAELYAACALLSDPPAEPVRFDDGTAGYLRLPSGTPSPGLVVLLPGLEPTKEQLNTYDLTGFDRLQPVTPESLREFAGAADLDGVLADLDAPVLVVHGERDTISPVAHAHRIAAELGDRATVRQDPDGNHSCNNIATVVRPFVADWVADRLEAA